MRKRTSADGKATQPTRETKRQRQPQPDTEELAPAAPVVDGVLPERVTLLSGGDGQWLQRAKGRGVVYWMSRDQRAADNWALLYARRLATLMGGGLSVVFVVARSPFLRAPFRHYHFMLSGLQHLEVRLASLGIPFSLLLGASADESPAQILSQWMTEQSPTLGALVTDFSPLRVARQWKADAVTLLSASTPLICQVDAHNIVPVPIASDKQEYAAHTLRPKLHRLLPRFLYDDPFPTLHPIEGEEASAAAVESFLQHRLVDYAEARNDPTLVMGQSQLSPYLHFGHIAPARMALRAAEFKTKLRDSHDAFIEELVVRRELAENYCFYNPDYDKVCGAASWARQTLDEHRNDERQYLYSLEDLECGRTHSALWNAAQRQMVVSGKMHGYLRMFWAKKILEWTASPEQAFEFAIHLNDRYSLDGRDPNGYVGIAWSIAGVHDRAWSTRPIFGKIRFMNEEGCKRKFSVPTYLHLVSKLENQSLS